MKTPLLSIITVVRNAASEIELTLRSIEQFKTEEVEYIILDGNSTDGTQAIIERYAHVVDFTKSETDGGIYEAMNEALHYAHGAFVLNINAGDYLLDLPLEELRQAQIDGLDLLACAVLEDNEEVHRPKWGNSLRFYNTLPHQGCCYKTTLFRQYRYDIRHRVFGDFDLNQRLFQAKANVRLCNRVIAFHSLRGVSNNPKFSNEMLGVILRNEGWFILTIAWLRFKYEGMKRRWKTWKNRNKHALHS